MKTRKFIPIVSISFLLLSLLLSSCGPGQLFGPTLTPNPTSTFTPTITLTITPTPSSTSTATITPTATTSPVPAAYQTLNVNEYASFTVYWKRDLWESAVNAAFLTEDFEKDEADYGELSFPYLTGNGFLLNAGECPAQILQDATLLESGNLLHFRDFGCGLNFAFPNDTAVSAFGFDYRPSEEWQLAVNDTVITIPEGRKGFLGFVIHENFPLEFRLFCREGAQGGLTVDNISYISTGSP